MKKVFDSKMYLEMQSQKILERIAEYDDKLYLEFGGKIFDDYHASRVLPGFEADTKVKMLLKIKNKVEVIIAVNAEDIQSNKIRSDLSITYENEVIRLINNFKKIDLYVSSVVITHYNCQKNADALQTRLNNLGINVYHHYVIEGYPTNIAHIVSDEGYGRNEFVETTRPIIVVTAPGPGSGKMATCLSQLYHENKRGKKAVYAKYETFPVWNLPLKHPVNLAYEAATADLQDVNMIDPFHYETYHKVAINYNRDVEVFPVLQALFNKIYGHCPYNSPTDMGVNMAGYCIIDEAGVEAACKQEIIRRYLDAKAEVKMGRKNSDVVDKIAIIMEQLKLSIDDRKTVKAALEKERIAQTPTIALELPTGEIVTGKTTKLMDAAAAVLINAIKKLSKLEKDLFLLSPQILLPIQNLKSMILRKSNTRLNANDVLIALSMEASRSPIVEKVFKMLLKLEGTQAHSTTILSSVDAKTFNNLKINFTYEPIIYAKMFYK